MDFTLRIFDTTDSPPDTYPLIPPELCRETAKLGGLKLIVCPDNRQCVVLAPGVAACRYVRGTGAWLCRPPYDVLFARAGGGLHHWRDGGKPAPFGSVSDVREVYTTNDGLFVVTATEPPKLCPYVGREAPTGSEMPKSYGVVWDGVRESVFVDAASGRAVLLVSDDMLTEYIPPCEGSSSDGESNPYMMRGAVAALSTEYGVLVAGAKSVGFIPRESKYGPILSIPIAGGRFIFRAEDRVWVVGDGFATFSFKTLIAESIREATIRGDRSFILSVSTDTREWAAASEAMASQLVEARSVLAHGKRIWQKRLGFRATVLALQEYPQSLHTYLTFVLAQFVKANHPQRVPLAWFAFANYVTQPLRSQLGLHHQVRRQS
jgi:hypothetical protein